MNKAGKQNSRGFLECAICQLIGFSQSIGKANHNLFYLFMHSYVKGYSFLDGSLLGQHTYLVGKKLSLPHEEPQVIFAIPAKEHFASAKYAPFWLFASGLSVNCDLGGQWAMDRFEK